MLATETEEYLSWLVVERGRSPNTLAAYRRDLAAYEAALAARGRSPLAATLADLEEHLATLRESGRSPATVARTRSAIRGLHRFLVDEGGSSTDPSGELDRVQVPRRLPKALSEADVANLLGAVRGSTAPARRDRALLELLYATGARISEAVGLDLGAWQDDQHLVRLYGKGSKERLVPVGRMAADAMAAWMAPGGRAELVPRRWQRRGDADAVFLNRRGGRLSRQGAFAVVRRYAEAAGLAVPVSPHVLRHSCATHMLAHGADIRVVQELLGHASIASTQLYTKVSAEHLRAAYQAAHPRAGRGRMDERPTL